LRRSIYSERSTKHDEPACGEIYIPRRVNQHNRIKIMGDRSPKSTQKKSSQKQIKASNAAQMKKAAAASKQAAGNKK